MVMARFLTAAKGISPKLTNKDQEVYKFGYQKSDWLGQCARRARVVERAVFSIALF